MNSNKPISSKQVGGTYGERRHMNSNHISQEPQIQRSKDFFGTKPVKEFASNAQFLSGKTTPMHKKIEAGRAHIGTQTSDMERFAFLDFIIAGPAENKPPSAATTSKTPIKSTTRLIKA